MNKRVIALGNFDGVHRGHAALLREAVAAAKERGCTSAALIFDRDPDNVFAGACVTPHLTDNESKAAYIRELGIDEVIYIPFDARTANLSPSAFVEKTVKEFGAAMLVCGFHYRFGVGASGNADTLKRLCEQMGIGCRVIEPVTQEGMLISSTKIRSLVRSGNMELAAKLIGRPFTVSGEVYHGKKLGVTLGFPTINQTLDDFSIVPMYGVYATRVLVNGEWCEAVTNVGVRPTVEKTRAYNIETYIIDRKIDLYGKTVPVAFYKMLRPETKFPSVEALREAIRENVLQTKEYFSLYK
jgi:riboflavin kinase/FMN adenylyltransferase